MNLHEKVVEDILRVVTYHYDVTACRIRRVFADSMCSNELQEEP